MYGPINKQIAYQVSGEHKVSETVGKKGLWLPSLRSYPISRLNIFVFQSENFMILGIGKFKEYVSVG